MTWDVYIGLKTKNSYPLYEFRVNVCVFVKNFKVEDWMESKITWELVIVDFEVSVGGENIEIKRISKLVEILVTDFLVFALTTDWLSFNVTVSLLEASVVPKVNRLSQKY